MGYQFWGEKAHEWAGMGIFILFLVHHILNLGWYKNLLKGNYPPFRIFQIVINVLALVSMLVLMYSSVILSRYVFSFLPIENGLALARRLHILGSHWGFLLMSLHIGLHLSRTCFCTVNLCFWIMKNLRSCFIWNICRSWGHVFLFHIIWGNSYVYSHRNESIK